MNIPESFETKEARDKRAAELKADGFKGIVKYSEPVRFEEMGTNWWEDRWFVVYEAKDLIYA